MSCHVKSCHRDARRSLRCKENLDKEQRVFSFLDRRESLFLYTVIERPFFFLSREKIACGSYIQNRDTRIETLLFSREKGETLLSIEIIPIQRRGVCCGCGNVCGRMLVHPLYREERHTLLCKENESLCSIWRRDTLFPGVYRSSLS